MGQLNRRRVHHTVSVIRGPDDTKRLFVAGGLTVSGGGAGGSILPQVLSNAELIEVSCECQAIELGGSGQPHPEIELACQRMMHTATALADGTVFLSGGYTDADCPGDERFNPAF